MINIDSEAQKYSNHAVLADAKEELITDFHLPSEKAIALVRTLFLANHLTAIAEEIAIHAGLTRAQSSVLHILHGVYPNHASVHFIKERIVVEKSDVSRLIKRLEKSGFVKCVTNETDRRAVKVTITKKGLDAVDILYEHSNDYLGPLTLLSEDEMKQFNATLFKLLKPITLNLLKQITY